MVMNELGENVLQKLSEEEKSNLESLVRDAIGFKQERATPLLYQVVNLLMKLP